MTVFDDLFVDFVEPALKENYGESVVHTAPDGTETTLTAIFDEETTREESIDGVRMRNRELPVVVFKSDLAGVTIGHGTITRNSETWTIDEITHETGTQFGLRLVRSEPAEIARPGFRGE